MGTLEELLDYYPYGDIRLDQKANSYSQQQKFTGYTLDADTGLNYAGARYYNGSVGRFMAQDAVSLAMGDGGQVSTQLQDPQSWNSYAYSRNNLLRYNDPDGQFWQENCPIMKKQLSLLVMAIFIAWRNIC